MLHSLVEFDASGEALMETVRPMIDSGTEGFKGQARLILPFKNACYECTLGDLPKQTTFQFHNSGDSETARALCAVRICD